MFLLDVISLVVIIDPVVSNDPVVIIDPVQYILFSWTNVSQHNVSI